MRVHPKRDVQKPDLLYRIGKVAEAIGVLVVYICGFLALFFLLKFITNGFKLTALDWIELLVAIPGGMGIYYCVLIRCEEIASKEHCSVDDAMFELLFQYILAFGALELLFNIVYFFFNEERVFEGTVSRIVAIVLFVICLHDLLLFNRRTEEGELVFEITPKGIRTTPGTRRLFQSSNDRKTPRTGRNRSQSKRDRKPPSR